MTFKNSIFTLLLAFCLLAPASADLFGPPTQKVAGIVNSTQPNSFTILQSGNRVIRILVRAGERLPSEVQLGMKVEAKIVQGSDRVWYLDSFTAVETSPTP